MYSNYTLSSRYGTPRSVMGATIICATANLTAQFKKATSYSEAKTILGSHTTNRLPLSYCQLLFEAGVKFVNIVGFTNNVDTIIEVLEYIKDLGFIIADIADDNSCVKLMDWVTKEASNQRETICFFARNLSSEVLKITEALNNERAIVCFPPAKYQGVRGHMFPALAMAGRLLAENKPNYNLNGLQLDIIEEPDELNEYEIQILISVGTTLFETVGNSTECIRGVTTRTNINGVPDYSMRSINTILIIDDVMRTIRDSLKERLRGNGIATNSLDSIASQVVIELSAKEQEGIIQSYQMPRVYPLADDPSVCVVELAFNVAHVISQIHITAHIGL